MQELAVPSTLTPTANGYFLSAFFPNHNAVGMAINSNTALMMSFSLTILCPVLRSWHP